MDYGHDHWWKIDDNTDCREISDDVVKLTNEVGLPWLYENHKLESISNFLCNSPSITDFSAALALGDKKEAIRRLEAAIKVRPRFTENAMAWAERVGLYT